MGIEIIVAAGFGAVLFVLGFLIMEVRQLGIGLGAVLRMVPAIQMMNRILDQTQPETIGPSGLRYKGDVPSGNGINERQRPLSDYPSQGGVFSQGAFYPHDVAGASQGVFTEPGPSVDEAAAELLARGRGD